MQNKVKYIFKEKTLCKSQKNSVYKSKDKFKKKIIDIDELIFPDEPRYISER